MGENPSNHIKITVDLANENLRLVESEVDYFAEVNLWNKLIPISIGLFILSIIMFFVPYAWLPPGQPLWILIAAQEYFRPALIALIGFILSACSSAMYFVVDSKVKRIKNELALTKEDTMFLRAYDTHLAIESYLEEPNLRRKSYHKKSLLLKIKKLIAILESWEYGNIRLIVDLIGEKIDLIKSNMKRLVLSNIAKGDRKALETISRSLTKLCEFILSPSIEQLDEINNIINQLQIKEYQHYSRLSSLKRSITQRPRALRFMFASFITSIVVGILLCLEPNFALAFGVGVTCFWGAFAGFDKIFNIKK